MGKWKLIVEKFEKAIINSISSFLNFIGIKIFSIDSPCIKVPKYVLSTKDSMKLNILFLLIGIIIGAGTILQIARFYPIHWN